MTQPTNAPPLIVPSSKPSARTSRLAIASLVLGLLMCVLGVLTGFPALVCGIVALVVINRSRGQLAGQGFAIAGIYLGVVSFFFTALIAAILIPNLINAKEQAERVHCASNLRQIYLALESYNIENAKYPATLTELRPRFLAGDGMLRCSRSATTDSYCYIHRRGMASDFPVSEWPVLIERADRHRQGSNLCANVVFADGHVECLPLASLAAKLESRAATAGISEATRNMLKEALAVIKSTEP